MFWSDLDNLKTKAQLAAARNLPVEMSAPELLALIEFVEELENEAQELEDTLVAKDRKIQDLEDEFAIEPD